MTLRPFRSKPNHIGKEAFQFLLQFLNPKNRGNPTLEREHRYSPELFSQICLSHRLIRIRRAQSFPIPPEDRRCNRTYPRRLSIKKEREDRFVKSLCMQQSHTADCKMQTVLKKNGCQHNIDLPKSVSAAMLLTYTSRRVATQHFSETLYNFATDSCQRTNQA